MSTKQLLSVKNLFDRLSTEIYYGFNMRMVLHDLREKKPDLYQVIGDFICMCKAGREAGERQGMK